MRGCGLTRFQHLLGRDPKGAGDFGNGRGTAELVSEAIGCTRGALGRLLEGAGNPERPALVTEVALELSRDRRHSERREGGTAFQIESVDGLQQPHRRDLNKVVEWLRATVVTLRQVRGQRKVTLQELVAGRQIAAAAIASEQLPLLQRARDAVRLRGAAAVVVRRGVSRSNPPLPSDGSGSDRCWRARGAAKRFRCHGRSAPRVR